MLNNSNNNSCMINKGCNEQCTCPKPGKSILSCGCGAAGPLPVLDLTGASIVNPYSVASTSIDTRGMHCPTVLINFTALINVPAGVFPNITFRLVRCINGCSQYVGGSYTSSSLINALSGKSFEFQICDCSVCCECCTYTLEISNATLAQIGTTVSGQITALAVEEHC